MGQVAIIAYKPKPGKETALRELVETHVPRLHKEGLVTNRGQILLKAADGTVIEIFEWLSPKAIQQAHDNPVVNQMWGEFAEVCDYIPLNQLPETANLFAGFTPLN
jgi:hypothetical protein